METAIWIFHLARYRTSIPIFEYIGIITGFLYWKQKITVQKSKLYAIQSSKGQKSADTACYRALLSN